MNLPAKILKYKTELDYESRKSKLSHEFFLMNSSSKTTSNLTTYLPARAGTAVPEVEMGWDRGPRGLNGLGLRSQGSKRAGTAVPEV